MLVLPGSSVKSGIIMKFVDGNWCEISLCAIVVKTSLEDILAHTADEIAVATLFSLHLTISTKCTKHMSIRNGILRPGPEPMRRYIEHGHVCSTFAVFLSRTYSAEKQRTRRAKYEPLAPRMSHTMHARNRYVALGHMRADCPERHARICKKLTPKIKLCRKLL